MTDILNLLPQQELGTLEYEEVNFISIHDLVETLETFGNYNPQEDAIQICGNKSYIHFRNGLGEGGDAYVGGTLHLLNADNIYEKFEFFFNNDTGEKWALNNQIPLDEENLFIVGSIFNNMVTNTLNLMYEGEEMCLEDYIIKPKICSTQPEIEENIEKSIPYTYTSQFTNVQLHNISEMFGSIQKFFRKSAIKDFSEVYKKVEFHCAKSQIPGDIFGEHVIQTAHSGSSKVYDLRWFPVTCQSKDFQMFFIHLGADQYLFAGCREYNAKSKGQQNFVNILIACASEMKLQHESRSKKV